MKYNGFNIPDNEIDKMVDALEISIAEACELWLADHDKMVNEEQEKANKLAETAPRRYEQGTTPRKKLRKSEKLMKTRDICLKSSEKPLKTTKIVQTSHKRMKLSLILMLLVAILP